MISGLIWNLIIKFDKRTNAEIALLLLTRGMINIRLSMDASCNDNNSKFANLVDSRILATSTRQVTMTKSRHSISVSVSVGGQQALWRP